MSVPSDDLRELLDAHADDLRAFDGARVLVTGGTGFVGTWLLASMLAGVDRLGLRLGVDVLTRDPDGFRASRPELANRAEVRLVRGDVRDPAAFAGLRADAVVHAATPASAAFAAAAPLAMLDTIVAGGRCALDFAATQGRIPLLFTSSGAVYGPQPADVDAVSETFGGGPDPLLTKNVYHEGKRVAELHCAIAVAAGAVDVKIARLFAFVGPYLPLDRHFAIGNFLRDALAGGPVRLTGDGTAVRSYQYAAEMTGWLWRIFARGASGRAYNVGSEAAYDLASVARAVARAAGLDPAAVTTPSVPVAGARVDRYVPSTARARGELGLAEPAGLGEAIARTLAWHRAP